MDDDNSVGSIRDDLDNYGDHLPVFIQGHNDRLYEVGEIYSSERSEGVIIIVTIGNPK